MLVPAYNEAENISAVVSELVAHRRNGQKVVDHIVVCDNASTDNTAYLAANAGAHVVSEAEQGYGSACFRAIKELKELGVQHNDAIVFADGDHSVKTSEIDDLLDSLTYTGGLVVGVRKLKLSQRGAMSPHQRIGNWMASWLIQLLWKVDVNDLGPFRALSYKNLSDLGMRDRRFGWTTEMQVKAIQRGLPYSEVYVSTKARAGKSKISGTLTGTVGAAYGIFSTVFKLWWQERHFFESQFSATENTSTKTQRP